MPMPLEVVRLCLGLAIAGFHVPIANFIIEREHSLLLALRRYGIEVPIIMSRQTAHSLYFCLGIGIALIQLLRLHQLSS